MRFRHPVAEDTAAVGAISLATGLAGGDAAHHYADGNLIGLIYSIPYARLEPGLALVVEDDQGVAGFAVGVLDTHQWERRLERDWWPSLRSVYPRPEEPSSGWTADQRRHAMIHAPELTPRSVTDTYPGHLHLNLSPYIQGRGLGKELLGRWLALAESKGTSAFHVGVNRGNSRGLEFWARNGFEALPAESSTSRTVWMGRVL